MSAWNLYKMVAQNMVRTYGVNQIFRFAEGIWLNRKSCQVRLFLELPSYISNLGVSNIQSLCFKGAGQRNTISFTD